MLHNSLNHLHTKILILFILRESALCFGPLAPPSIEWLRLKSNFLYCTVGYAYVVHLISKREGGGGALGFRDKTWTFLRFGPIFIVFEISKWGFSIVQLNLKTLRI